MDRLDHRTLTGGMTTTTTRTATIKRSHTATSTTAPPDPSPARPVPAAVRAAIAKRSFCTLATTSVGGRSHVAGVLYVACGDVLYVNTLRPSRKARNIDVCGTAAVCIPVRRLPVGPPSSIQFQGPAQLVALDAPEITELVAGGALKAITGHGELEAADGCFLRIDVPKVVHTYGLGLSLRQLLRDPLHAGARVELS